MKLKRFFAPDMRQAMSLVRDRIGPDAVIVGNKTTAEGVEIIVAIEEAEEIAQSKQANKVVGGKILQETVARDTLSHSVDDEGADEGEVYVRPKKLAPQTNTQRVKKETVRQSVSGATLNDEQDIMPRNNSVYANEKANSDTVAQDARGEQPTFFEQREIFDQVKSELQSLRSLIQAQLTSNTIADAIRAEPAKHELLKNLLEMSFSPQVIRRVFSGLSNRDGDQLLPHAMILISKWLSVYPGDLLDNGGVVALVGPTGVGKTTTIAKLAAKFVLRHGKNQLALVNLDNYRIGAHENLKIYGRILGVPARTAGNAAELQQILKENYGKKLVLLDTAGIGQRDGRIDELGGFFNEESAGIKTCLVLAANVTNAVLRETIQRFQPRRLSGVILTKLDETSAMGAALSELITQKLPLVYLADGQRVPEDLHRAEPTQIVEQAYTLWKQNKQWMEKETVELMAGGFAQYVEER
ncbi:MAG: flagellar biosynthesis protein FlhF [Pseudomonadota bacterium]